MSVESRFLYVKPDEILIDHDSNARRRGEKGYDSPKGGKYAGGSTIAALRASIKRDGLQTPLLVRELSTERQAETQKRYELLGGFRRMEAIGGIKGIETLPANVMAAETATADAMAGALVNNIQRNQLTAAELAKGLTDLREEMVTLDKGGKEKYPSYDALAKRVGLSKGYANSLVSLRLNLCPEVWGAFEGGHPKATVRLLCDEIMRIEDPIVQHEKWLSLIDENPKNNGTGDGGDGDGDGDNGPDPEKPPRALSRKAILEAVDFLKEHRKHSTPAQLKSAEYYKACIQWLEYAAGSRAKSPLKIRTWGGTEGEE